MDFIQPKVFLVGETRVIDEDIQNYLEHVGAPEWTTDAASDSEKLIEIMGRLCYRSFKPGLNPNVTRVRTGNANYLGHVLQVGHGSVIEHSVLNFIFADVSRVFTHELVRHRAGTAISQESLRFVRLDKLSVFLPTVIRENEKLMGIFEETIPRLEDIQKEMAEIAEIDKEGMDFSIKKKLTSAFRRLAPDGLATSIGWSCNFRALRHVLEMRTAPDAEEEIRVVFGQVYEKVKDRYPALMGDYEVEMADGHPWVMTKHKKV